MCEETEEPDGLTKLPLPLAVALPEVTTLEPWLVRPVPLGRVVVQVVTVLLTTTVTMSAEPVETSTARSAVADRKEGLRIVMLERVTANDGLVTVTTSDEEVPLSPSSWGSQVVLITPWFGSPDLVAWLNCMPSR
jgi:hypothetical protein